MCALALHDPTAEEPVADDDYTLAEVVRLVQSVREDVNAQFVGLRAGMEDFVLKEVYEERTRATNERLEAVRRAHDADHAANASRIRDLEDTNTWLVRIIGALIVVGVFAAVFGTAALGGR